MHRAMQMDIPLQSVFSPYNSNGGVAEAFGAVRAVEEDDELGPDDEGAGDMPGVAIAISEFTAPMTRA